MKKSYKIVFIGSLLPYVCVLIYAVYSAINGIEYSFMMTREIIYGFNGFGPCTYRGLHVESVFPPIADMLYISAHLPAFQESGKQKADMDHHPGYRGGHVFTRS